MHLSPGASWQEPCLRHPQEWIVLDRALGQEKSGADQSSEVNQGHNHSPWAIESKGTRVCVGVLPPFLWLLELRIGVGRWGREKTPGWRVRNCPDSFQGNLRQVTQPHCARLYNGDDDKAHGLTGSWQNTNCHFHVTVARKELILSQSRENDLTSFLLQQKEVK